MSLLPELADVDRPEDMKLLERDWGKEKLAEALGKITIPSVGLWYFCGTSNPKKYHSP